MDRRNTTVKNNTLTMVPAPVSFAHAPARG
jgi:hypothetical protein